VLQAANSEGDSACCTRSQAAGWTGGHRRVHSRFRTTRIALDVGEDAVYFNNPDLPKTRSEMRCRLKSQGKSSVSWMSNPLSQMLSLKRMSKFSRSWQIRLPWRSKVLEDCKKASKLWQNECGLWRTNSPVLARAVAQPGINLPLRSRP